jgi:Kdo2-lipid IVA lauroyltransferase/acyltransferase
MNSETYSFRPNLFARERTYRLEPSGLLWSDGTKAGCIRYDEVKEVRLYRKFMRGKAAIYKAEMSDAHLHCRRGQLVLSPLHYAGFRTWEDRSARYRPFVDTFLAQLHAHNPNARFVPGFHWTMRLRRYLKRRVGAMISVLLPRLLRLLRRFHLERTADFGAWLMRRFGPWSRAHIVARDNLQAAFPEKSSQEINDILNGVWDNFGRALVEYAFLDRVWDFDLQRFVSSRIEFDPRLANEVARLRQAGKSVLVFAAHLANWELPAVLGAAVGLHSAMLYRPPGGGSLTKHIIGLRNELMGSPIISRFGAVLEIIEAMRGGRNIGILVDQHTNGGVDVTFFGRPCKVSPTLARLARQFECPVYGTRAIRLPQGRFRMELVGPLELPRNAHGMIEIAETMQLVTAIIEQWVREYPEQWLWMHRRWR